MTQKIIEFPSAPPKPTVSVRESLFGGSLRVGVLSGRSELTAELDARGAKQLALVAMRFAVKERAKEWEDFTLAGSWQSPVVYFIQAGAGAIKIGVSQTPASRMASLQTGHDERLHLLAVAGGGHEQERILHRKFDHIRLRHDGEWFAGTVELLAYILDRPFPTEW